MQNPLEITFKNIEKDLDVEVLIQEKFDKVTQINSDVIKCHVVMEQLSRHHNKGNAYCVRLDLKFARVPEILIKEESKEGDSALSSVVRSVFKKAHELLRKQNVCRRTKDSLSDYEEVEEDAKEISE